MMLLEDENKVLLVNCPICHSAAGNQCMIKIYNGGGTQTRYTSTFHSERVILALHSEKPQAHMQPVLREPIGRPPFETFKKAVCKGSLALGSACGHCEKCLWYMNNPGAI